MQIENKNKNKYFYYSHVIKHLIHKMGYDFNRFIADETNDDFNAVSYRNRGAASHFYIPPPPPSQSYGPPSTNTLFSTNEGYKYDPPKSSHSNYGLGTSNRGYNDDYPEPIYIPRPTNHPYQSYSPLQTANHQNNNGYNYFPPSSQSSTSYNAGDVFKRFIRDLSLRDKYEKPEMLENDDNSVSVQKQFIEQITPESRSRNKRQSRGRFSLCDTKSSFIAPQAALSSNGMCYLFFLLKNLENILNALRNYKSNILFLTLLPITFIC